MNEEEEEEEECLTPTDSLHPDEIFGRFVFIRFWLTPLPPYPFFSLLAWSNFGSPDLPIYSICLKRDDLITPLCLLVF